MIEEALFRAVVWVGITIMMWMSAKMVFRFHAVIARRALRIETEIPLALTFGHIQGLREAAAYLATNDPKRKVREEIDTSIERLTKQADQLKQEVRKMQKAIR